MRVGVLLSDIWHGGAIPDSQMSQGAGRDIAPQTLGHWPAIAGPGSKLPVGLGRSSTPRKEKKGKVYFQKSANSKIRSALSFAFCFCLWVWGFVFVLFCFILLLLCHTKGFNFIQSCALFRLFIYSFCLEFHLERFSQPPRLRRYSLVKCFFNIAIQL